MSYIRRKTIHPSAMGGVEERETMYGGKRRRKKRTVKRGGKSRLAGVGIRAPASGIAFQKRPKTKPRKLY